MAERGIKLFLEHSFSLKERCTLFPIEVLRELLLTAEVPTPKPKETQHII